MKGYNNKLKYGNWKCQPIRNRNGWEYIENQNIK